MANPLIFEIPIRTVSETNQRCHWAKKAKRTKEQRGLAGLFTRQWLNDLPPKPWRITMTRVGKRRLDAGNVPPAMKGPQDGMCDALGIDDGDEAHEWSYKQRVAKEYGIEVKIETIEPLAASEAA